MREGVDVERAVAVPEIHEVQRRKVARRIVEEHVFRARIRGIDPAGLRAGMPLVDGGIELNARIGAGPGSLGDLVPELAGLDGL